jgi:glycerate 2-kinase
MDLRQETRRILAAALAAVEPRALVAAALVRSESGVRVGASLVPLGPRGRVLVVAAGKAAVGMALGARDALGERIATGMASTIPALAAAVPGMEVWPAAHPTPDSGSLAAAAEALRLARSAGRDDLVLCLLSGGASSLWSAPAAGLSLDHLGRTTSALLARGAPIHEVNTVRKHLSGLAGGWLARAAAPARLATLAISDVVGATPDVIGSGPTLPDPSTYRDAMEVLRSRGISPPPAVLHHLQRGMAGVIPETPKPGAAMEDALFEVIADNGTALAAAAAEARSLGFEVIDRAEALTAEACRAGAALGARGLEILACTGRTGPIALLTGGETTVTVRGDGRGGRNQELALAAALVIGNHDGIVIASFGTDGVDGPTPAAGAVVDGGTVERGRIAGLDAADCLARNDSHTFLAASGDLLVTGPTGTNVADLAMALVRG